MRAKLLSSAATLALLWSGTALAADMKTAPAPVADVPAPYVASLASVWSGFHVGLHAGVGGSALDYPFGATDGAWAIGGAGHMDASGFLGGAQIGYDWVFPNRILLGLEADISGTDVKSRLGLGGSVWYGDSWLGSASGSVGTTLDYIGTVRGRLGYLVSDPWLVYVTGGWAYGSVKSSYALGYSTDGYGDGGWAGHRSNTMSGWVAGVGTAYALSPNMTIRAEYLHADLGSDTLMRVDDLMGYAGKMKISPAYDFVRVGFDYKIDALSPAAPALAPAPLAAPTKVDWTGLHIGLNGGYGGGENSYPVGGSLALGDVPYSLSGSGKLRNAGFIGGAQIGYDLQFTNRMVVGLEADFDWANVDGHLGLGGALDTGSASYGAAAAAGTSLDWFGTVRARLGYAVSDPLLVYVTGGWAYGRTDTSYHLTVPDLSVDYAGSKKNDHNGWALGAGLDYAVTPNLSLRAEYLHVDFDSKKVLDVSYGPAAARLKVDPSYDFMRVGVNYKFDLGSTAAGLR